MAIADCVIVMSRTCTISSETQSLLHLVLMLSSMLYTQPCSDQVLIDLHLMQIPLHASMRLGGLACKLRGWTMILVDISRGTSSLLVLGHHCRKQVDLCRLSTMQVEALAPRADPLCLPITRLQNLLHQTSENGFRLQLSSLWSPNWAAGGVQCV